MADTTELERLLAAGDVEGCLAFFRGMPERERRAYAKAAIAGARAIYEEWIVSEQPGGGTRQSRKAGWDDRRLAADAVAWATGNHKELNRAGLWYTSDAMWSAVADRQPAWLDEWAIAELDQGPRRFGCVQEAVTRGLIEKPDHENYTAGFIYAFETEAREVGLAAALRQHPNFLEGDLWRLFEIEGTSESNLAAHDKYAPEAHHWDRALLTLCEDGTLPRERLLDASLAALARDFMQQRAGWFSRFHELLAPTPAERLSRRDRYLHLLGSSIPTTVSFALKALVALDKEEPTPVEDLLAHLPPTLLARTKATVKLALRLVRAAVQRAPEREAELAAVAAQALLHESGDVQALVLDFLDTTGDDDAVCAAVAAAGPGIAPSLQPRLVRYGGGTTDEEVAVDHQSLRASPVSRIDDANELLREFAAVLEDPSDALAVERVLEALPRYRGADLDCAALAQRATTIIERYVDPSDEDPIQRNLARLAQAWHTGEAFEPWTYRAEEYSGASVAPLFAQRLADLWAAEGADAFLLSSPTDTRGCIEPATLAARAQASTLASPADQVLALLRLGPDGRDAALAAAGNVPGEFGQALRHALGGTGEVIGDRAELWIAAARARDPLGDDARVAERHGSTGPGGARAAHCTLGTATTPHGYEYLVVHRDPPCPETVPMLHPTVLFHQGATGRYRDVNAAGQCASLVRFAGILAPTCTEDYFAVAIERIDPDWSQVQWEVRHFFEPLLFAEVPLGPNAYRLLALGLAAKEAGQWGTAVDCAVAAIADRRLSPRDLGAAMAEVLDNAEIKAGRWAKTLGEVARVSTAAATACRDAIEATLAGGPTRLPKDLGKLLETCHELCVQVGGRVDDPAARACLEGLTKGGKTAQLRKKLLAL